MKTVFTLSQALVLVCVQQIQIASADSSIPPVASFGAASITALQSSGEVKIPVKLTGAALVDFFGTTVQCTSVDGTAKWPNDYDTVFSSVKFVSGETDKTLIIGLPTSPIFQGTKTFTVRLNNSSDYNLGSPSTITVKITGAVTIPEPNIVVQHPFGISLNSGASVVNFGNGAPGTSSVPKTFMIRNTGPGILTGFKISKSGVNSSSFSVSNPSNTSLTQGNFTTFSVVFSPKSPGQAAATILIESNDVDKSPFSISLAGASFNAPEIVVAQPNGGELSDNGFPVNLGEAPVGKASESKTFTVSNSGSADLTGVSVSLSGMHTTDFAAGVPPASTIPPGNSTSFTVIFKPSSPGTRTATMLIASNDPDENPFDIRVMGTGTVVDPPPVKAPEIEVRQPRDNNLVDGQAKRSFGRAKVGSRGMTRKFTIRNTGTATLTGIVVRKGGTGVRNFIVSGPAKRSLPPGKSTTFTVRFRPRTLGFSSARIQIQSNDADKNPFNIGLTGSGTRK